MIANALDQIEYVVISADWFITISHGSVVVWDDSDLSQEMPKIHLGVLLYIDMKYWNDKAQFIVDHYFEEFLA